MALPCLTYPLCHAPLKKGCISVCLHTIHTHSLLCNMFTHRLKHFSSSLIPTRKQSTGLYLPSLSWHHWSVFVTVRVMVCADTWQFVFFFFISRFFKLCNPHGTVCHVRMFISTDSCRGESSHRQRFDSFSSSVARSSDMGKLHTASQSRSRDSGWLCWSKCSTHLVSVGLCQVFPDGFCLAPQRN